MSLVLCWDLPCPSVRLYVFIVREFIVSGCNEGRFECSVLFYKLKLFIIANRDYSDLEVYPFLLLSSDPQLP